MIFIVIIIVILVLLLILFRRSKRFYFDNVVMLNGSIGSGKTSTGVKIAFNSINKAHSIWWRKKYIYSKIFKFKYNKYALQELEEEPLLYSNIPLKHRLYTPLTTDILKRQKRCHYKSVIFIDESSLLATSLDYKDKELSESLTLFLKLVRHSLHGSYRNLLGSYPNLIITTQSKNDNHFAFDRTLNQVLYIFKSINIPFFKVVWARDLLLIDSVLNNFDDDIKQSFSIRWFLVPKSIFKKYNSYCYSFLSDQFEKIGSPKTITNLHKRFEIPTFHSWREILLSNNEYHNYLKSKQKEKEKNIESDVIKGE